MSHANPAPYEAFDGLRVDRPADGILRITLDAPPLNAVNAAAHEHLADIWPVFDRDAEARVAVIRGNGRGFSAGGDFEMITGIIDD
ncbi:MAG: enoyl-CoA hydratase, partial [Actinobacteria bacterium]|nr:enoyl-CoA hydratase [Actinomycetota bacterium]